ncbi:MAG: tellurite resistance TerB family protein [Pseudomonas sp.]|nr:tellurite resistance TerB family protein [Pseudomonas sp.]MDD2223815.1 tellurite resistance TerB family protein [Pseudomonas sp.]MDY0415917.1 tellurite resistance TerB family protein [Pseudomonas sp.]NLO53424.1 tellurite resistance TerB family protein [Gammaproteobacteria bacterium]
MDSRGLLDQLLGAGKSLLKESGVTTQEGGVSDFGKGAATGGLVGLLLGSKTGRKLATYGGIAALGAVAWRAYTQHRSEASKNVPALPQLNLQTENRAVLRAVLAAARVDGHIDERERALIDQEIARHGGDASLRNWMEAQLNAPLDPQAIAREVADDPLLASEVYLVSALVIGDAGFLERSYLDRLAEQLGLDAELKLRLESDALSGQAY